METDLSTKLENLAILKKQMWAILSNESCTCCIDNDKILRGLVSYSFTPTVEQIETAINKLKGEECAWCISKINQQSLLDSAQLEIFTLINLKYELTAETNPLN